MKQLIIVIISLIIAGCSQSKSYIKPYDYQSNREAVLVYEKALLYEKKAILSWL